jgi:hypothetical protein
MCGESSATAPCEARLPGFRRSSGRALNDAGAAVERRFSFQLIYYELRRKVLRGDLGKVVFNLYLRHVLSNFTP